MRDKDAGDQFEEEAEGAMAGVGAVIFITLFVVFPIRDYLASHPEVVEYLKSVVG